MATLADVMTEICRQQHPHYLLMGFYLTSNQLNDVMHILEPDETLADSPGNCRGIPSICLNRHRYGPCRGPTLTVRSFLLMPLPRTGRFLIAQRRRAGWNASWASAAYSSRRATRRRWRPGTANTWASRSRRPRPTGRLSPPVLGSRRWGPPSPPPPPLPAPH